MTNEKCTYPDCSCPFDIGPDNKCLRGLENDIETSPVTVDDLVSIIQGNSDIDENHAQLQSRLDELDNNTLKALMTRAVYAIDAFINMKE